MNKRGKPNNKNSKGNTNNKNIASSKKAEKDNTLNQATLLLLGFALIAFLLGKLYYSNKGIDVQTIKLNKSGVFQEIDIKSKSSSYWFMVYRTNFNNKEWTSVSVEVLDSMKNYLFSLSDELWYETGYDSEGSWTESNRSFDSKITLKRGKYYLSAQIEKSKNAHNSPVYFKYAKIRGSSVYLYLLAFLFLISGIITNEIKNHTIQQIIIALNND